MFRGITASAERCTQRVGGALDLRVRVGAVLKQELERRCRQPPRIRRALRRSGSAGRYDGMRPWQGHTPGIMQAYLSEQVSPYA